MNQPTAEVTTEIRATPDEIWKALTTPSLLKKFFMGSDIESDFKVGSPIGFRGVFKGREYEDKGEIQAGRPGPTAGVLALQPAIGAAGHAGQLPSDLHRVGSSRERHHCHSDPDKPHGRPHAL